MRQGSITMNSRPIGVCWDYLCFITPPGRIPGPEEEKPRRGSSPLAESRLGASDWPGGSWFDLHWATEFRRGAWIRHLCTGLFTLGQLSLGVLVGIGQLATGFVAIGQATFGYYVLAQSGTDVHVWDAKGADEVARQFFSTWTG